MTLPTRARPFLPLAALAAALAAGCAAPVRTDFAVPDAPAPLETATPAPPLPALDAPLTAGDIVRLVRERNPSLAAAKAAVEAALGGIDAAEAALRPRISIETSFLTSDAPSAYLFRRIDSHTMPARVDFNDPGRISDTQAALALRWNAWDGGRARLGTWSAESDADAAGLMAAAVENALAAAALTAVLDVRAAEDLVASDDASVRTVEAQVAETRTKVEGGGALRSDLLSLEVRLAEARERRIGSDIARRQGLTALRSLLALPAGTEVRVAGVRYDPGDMPETLVPALAEAYRRRPDVAAARRAVESARIRLEAARRGNLPRVDLEARTWTDTGHASLRFQDPNWTLAVAVTFDVFDGGATDAAVRQAQAALRAVEAADRRSLLDVAGDVERALLRLEEARARVAVASQAVAASEESLFLVETQFRGGGANVTRYLEAEGARTSTRTADVSARRSLERALVDVARALGRFSDPQVKETVR